MQVTVHLTKDEGAKLMDPVFGKVVVRTKTLCTITEPAT